LTLAAFTISPQSSLLHSGANAQSANQKTEQDDARDWRGRLETSDLDAREHEFEALVDHARESAAARASVEAWSKDSEHLEFAWTCRLALREVNARTSMNGAWGQFDDPFEAIRKRMFSGGFGGDPFGGFMLDPFTPGQGGRHGLGDPFQNLPQGSNTQSEAQSFSLEVGPDGVKARVKKNVNGEEHVDEYSAKTVDELLLAHPELSPQIRGGNSGLGGFGMRFGTPGFDFDRGQVDAPRTDVLGVYIANESSNDSTRSEGLRIERVQPGSLAEKLGLEAGQVLLSLNGRALKTRDDISAVLRERKSDAAIEVEVRGSDGVQSTKTWKPSQDNGDGRGAAHPLQPRALKDARKI
jgi:hypothetical protein